MSNIWEIPVSSSYFNLLRDAKTSLQWVSDTRALSSLDHADDLDTAHGSELYW